MPGVTRYPFRFRSRGGSEGMLPERCLRPHSRCSPSGRRSRTTGAEAPRTRRSLLGRYGWARPSSPTKTDQGPVCDTSISDRLRMSQGRRPPCPRGRNHGIHDTRGARMMPATQGLAGASARRPWLVVGLWIAAIAIAGYASSQFLAGALTTKIEVTNDPEAQRAADLIERRFGAAGVTEVFILTSEDATVSDASFERAVRSLQASASDGGAEAVTFYDTGDPAMVSDDRHTTLMPITFPEPDENADLLPAIEGFRDEAHDSGVLTARSMGAVSIEEDFNRIAEEDLAQGESFGILVALLVLVFVFGAVVAGVVPLIMGIASIAVALGITALVGLTVDFSFFCANIITMMGLAIGIDYSLFMVSRFREERTGGRHKLDAIGATGATAGRAVLFSGLTVVLALLGMLIVPNSIF